MLPSPPQFQRRGGLTIPRPTAPLAVLRLPAAAPPWRSAAWRRLRVKALLAVPRPCRRRRRRWTCSTARARLPLPSTLRTWMAHPLRRQAAAAAVDQECVELRWLPLTALAIVDEPRQPVVVHRPRQPRQSANRRPPPPTWTPPGTLPSWTTAPWICETLTPCCSSAQSFWLCDAWLATADSAYLAWRAIHLCRQLPGASGSMIVRRHFPPNQGGPRQSLRQPAGRQPRSLEQPCQPFAAAARGSRGGPGACAGAVGFRGCCSRRQRRRRFDGGAAAGDDAERRLPGTAAEAGAAGERPAQGPAGHPRV